MAHLAQVAELRNSITAFNQLIGSPFSLICGKRAKARFFIYMAATCHVVRASTDLMQCAIDRFEYIYRGEKNKEVDYLRQHINEESDHYNWLVQDLALISNDAESLLATTYIPSILSIAGNAYYQIRNASPYSIYGYAATLESNPPEPGFLDLLSDELSLPNAGMSTLALHGKIDPQHSTEIFDHLDSLTLSQEDFFHIKRTAILTATGYAKAFGELLSHE